MAGTILVREALRRASVLLNDISPTQFKRHPETGMVDSLNDGALAICKYLPQAGSRLDAVRLVPGTRQSIKLVPQANILNGDGSSAVAVQGISLVGAGVVRNMGSNGTTPGRAVRIIDRKTQDTADPDWHLASRAGTVVRAVMHDPLLPHYFYVDPPVHASTPVWVELAWNAQPTRVANTGTPGAPVYHATGSNTVPIPIGDEYLDDLVNYVVARELMKESEWMDAGKAAAFARMFLDSLNGMVAALTGVNPNLKRLPFAPEPAGVAA
jgi:hypothetical protein